MPMIRECIVTTLGAEGNQGVGAASNDGIDGVAEQTLQL